MYTPFKLQGLDPHACCSRTSPASLLLHLSTLCSFEGLGSSYLTAYHLKFSFCTAHVKTTVCDLQGCSLNLNR